MRYIVYGAGAIGCTLGAHLSRLGHDVVLVGRGEHARRIRREGLAFATGDESFRLRLPIHESAAALYPFSETDVVLLCVKSQHTLQCLGQLKNAGAPRDLAVVCCQNSILNEPTVARVVHRVYGMSTLVRAIYVEPGVVLNPMTGRYGFVEIGRFPSGVDSVARQIVSDLEDSGFSAGTHDDIMKPKAAKCLANLANVVRALTGSEDQGDALIGRLRDEAMAVWQACGIEWEDYEVFRGRVKAFRGVWKVPDGYEDLAVFGSSWQSLERKAGSIETAFLNGDVARLGEIVGVEAPYNALVTRLAEEMAKRRQPPGQYTEEELLAMI